MKIEPVTCIWVFVCAMNFWAARNAQNEVFDFSSPTCVGLFHSYFGCKCNFREISMIKMVISYQNKQIWLILKIKNKKIKKLKICKLHVYYS